MVRTTKKTDASAAVVAAPLVVVEAPVAPVQAPVEEVAPVAAPVVAEKKKKTKTKKPVAATTPAPVEETVVVAETTVVAEEVVEETVASDVVEEAVEETIVTDVAATVETKKRRVVTKEKLLIAIEDLTKDLTVILESGNHKKLLKQYKVVIADAYRLMKIKTAQKKAKDATNSGFMRPVKPSASLELFLTNINGETSEEKPLTRAYLTTLICKYIKDKDLQNPKDRRIIFPDEELKTLFQITEKDTEPLTYYNIQKRLQPLVSKIEEEAPVAAPIVV